MLFGRRSGREVRPEKDSSSIGEMVFLVFGVAIAAVLVIVVGSLYLSA